MVPPVHTPPLPSSHLIPCILTPRARTYTRRHHHHPQQSPPLETKGHDNLRASSMDASHDGRSIAARVMKGQRLRQLRNRSRAARRDQAAFWIALVTFALLALGVAAASAGDCGSHSTCELCVADPNGAPAVENARLTRCCHRRRPKSKTKRRETNQHPPYKRSLPLLLL